MWLYFFTLLLVYLQKKLYICGKETKIIKLWVRKKVENA